VILGDPDHFRREHYEARSGSAPAHLCELVVHCLELVSQLEHHGLSFRFKGGNSLLVLLEDPQRFSIDVDIVTTEPKERVTEVVARVVERAGLFTRWESRAPKTKPWLPMISFKLFFDSVYRPETESFVMLDAVLEAAPYPGERRPVRCLDIYRSTVHVEVPTVSGLIGDKLLTLGPGTLGIPLGKGKEAHRLKHVFDVALLARQGYDPAAVRESLSGCLDQENRIQRTSFSLHAIVEDTVRFCREPLAHDAPPPTGSFDEASYLGEVVRGFDEFRRHLFRLDYGWPMLRDDCRRILTLLDQL
jgi:hypothetical protein